MKTFLCLILSIFSLEASQLLPGLQQRGYVEICNETHGAESFDNLYLAFDAFIKFVDTHSEARKKLAAAKSQFWDTDIGKFYGTPFVGYADESKLTHRKLYYFYYSSDFHNFLLTRYSKIMQGSPEILQFLDLCRAITNSSIEMFGNAIEELAIDPLFSSTENRLPVLLKVVKYLPASCTVAHFDASALTLMLDSTDLDSLVFSPYMETIASSDFFAPSRQYSRSVQSSSCLLISGKFLTAKDIPINPTPHAALRKDTIRHAAIAFALIPYYQSGRLDLPLLPQL